jgi:hypothetical protein
MIYYTILRRRGHIFFLIGISALVLLGSHWAPPPNGLECGIPKTITGIY